MIEKQRLEELIEQGATVYSLDTKYYGCVKYLELENKLEKVEYDKNGEVKLFITDNGWWHWFSLKDLYESKEDVEWFAKYQNISRTDYLNLPTYEEFIENYRVFGWECISDEMCVMFNYKTNVYSLYAVDNEIWIGKDNDGSAIFHKKLNKENYIEACDICVKLFKGEE